MQQLTRHFQPPGRRDSHGSALAPLLPDKPDHDVLAGAVPGIRQHLVRSEGSARNALSRMADHVGRVRSGSEHGA
eukprot:9911683-Alexandrium_andersonii.AAC.1